ncbi:Uncharacterised protein [Bacillus freudenreichii]|nr:Uncharacterised protein [Bacillus freudenreichii]
MTRISMRVLKMKNPANRPVNGSRAIKNKCREDINRLPGIFIVLDNYFYEERRGAAN